MDNMGLYFEYIKVLAAYAALFYVWPGFVFHRYLKGKGLTFRFIFCSVVSVVIFNGLILGLGLFEILNVWFVRVLFWGIPVLSFVLPTIPRKQQNEESGVRTEEKQRIMCRIKKNLAALFGSIPENGKCLWQTYKIRIPEYLMLILILIFGMAYFSIGMFHDYSYGCYDHYTHYRWITELNQGSIFTEGIYPEAMHCFIYGMRYLLGVNLHSCLLFLAGIHISMFLLAAYCLMKEVFQCRCTPLFVLIAWLTFDLYIEGDVMHPLYLSITRLTWTYPQEFGMYLVFLCPLFLLRYFRQKQEEAEIWNENDNLLLLMLGVGAAISTHFYVIIFAFFLCVPVVVVHYRKILLFRQIRNLLYAVGFGTCIGAFPMMAAYIMGVYPEKSLRWGIGRFNGVSEEAVNYHAGGNHLLQTGNFVKDIYEKGYMALFGKNVAFVLAVLSVIIVVSFCAGYEYLCHRRRDRKLQFAGIFTGYLYIVGASLVCIFLYAAPYMGLPEFIAVDRIYSIVKMLALSVFGVIIDCILLILCIQIKKNSVRSVTVLGCVLIYCFAYMTDFHEYLYLVMTRYNAEVFVTNEITERFGQSSYRIISMQYEKGQLEEVWRHEELLDFIQSVDEEEYYLPEEYIFLYVEKHPLVLGQIHYVTGPAWLADDSSLFSANEVKSRCPDVLHTEISWELSQQDVSYYQEKEENYFDTMIRSILCSKAYYWYQDFSEKYPSETEVYYEDEDFVCFKIHQSPGISLNLSLGV